MMGVIRTDKWITEMYSKPIELCKELLPYFQRGTSAREIYHYLNLHGMYRPKQLKTDSPLTTLPDNVLKIVSEHYKVLQQEWKGPEVPVFIFPSDESNKNVTRDFNGKSGLAFNDKLFLFFANHNNKEEIKAVLTHEYNHVCRLAKYKREESSYTLLDTIILEGLAENAVREYCGKSALASWTSYYTEEQLNRIVEKTILPNHGLKRTERKHNELLYGRGLTPKMAGYCAGYYLVRKYVEKTNVTCKEILGIESSEFIENKTGNILYSVE